MLCGDFNVNFLSKENKQSYLRELTQTFDLKLVIENLITQEKRNSSSYIDLFFTKFESEVTRQRTKITGHYSLFLKLKNKTNIKTGFIFFQSRNWAKLENSFLQEKIIVVPWQRLKQIDLTEKEINDKFKCSQRIVEVFDIINNAPNKCSEDCYDLNYYCIKKFSNVLSPFLSKWFNECFNHGVFPDCPKIAKVFPLHKSGDKSIPSNFMPISLLPTIAKIFEKLLQRIIISF